MKRRHILEGAAATLALSRMSPVFTSMAHAQAAPAIKRFVTVFIPNGTSKTRDGFNSRWFPAHDAPNAAGDPMLIALNDRPMGDPDASFLECLAPLLPYRQQMLMFANRRAENGDPNNIHGLCIRADPSATGHEGFRCTTAGPATVRGGDTSQWSTAATDSIDQIVAANNSGPGLGALILGVNDSTTAGPLRRVSWRNRVPNDVVEPSRAFDAAFAGFQPTGPSQQPDPSAQRALRRRRSVLAYSRQQLQAYRAQLGRDDRARLDQHEALVRDLEQRLQGGGGATSQACNPTRPQDATGVAVPDVLNRSIDVITAAFACNRSRTAVLHVGGPQSKMTLPWINIGTEWHDVSHSNRYADIAAISHWTMTVVARLVDRLRAITDTDGQTMDKNTLIYVTHECSYGNSHSLTNMPVLVIGGGWFLKQGYLVRADRPINDLLISIANAMGVTLSQLGESDQPMGPFTQIVR